jgi:hypothetical protein
MSQQAMMVELHGTAASGGFGAAGRRRTRPSQARHGVWTGLAGRPGPAGRGAGVEGLKAAFRGMDQWGMQVVAGVRKRDRNA